MSHADKIDTMALVETPEGVHLNLRCAGMPARMLAGLIDLIILLVVLWVFMIVAGLAVSVLGEVAAVGILLGFFVISWFYPAVSEILMDGQTFGKRMVGLRVVQTSGAPLSWRNAVTRSVLWSIDLLFCISLPVMLLGRDFRRIGDLAADTIVVYDDGRRDRRRKKARSWPEGTPARVGQFSVEETRAIVAFAERYQDISRERQRELAGIIAAGLDCTREEAVQALYDHALFVQGINR